MVDERVSDDVRESFDPIIWEIRKDIIRQGVRAVMPGGSKGSVGCLVFFAAVVVFIFMPLVLVTWMILEILVRTHLIAPEIRSVLSAMETVLASFHVAVFAFSPGLGFMIGTVLSLKMGIEEFHWIGSIGALIFWVWVPWLMDRGSMKRLDCAEPRDPRTWRRCLTFGLATWIASAVIIALAGLLIGDTPSETAMAIGAAALLMLPFAFVGIRSWNAAYELARESLQVEWISLEEIDEEYEMAATS